MEHRDPTLCSGFAKEGEPCRMRRLTGSDFCFWHDPERMAARAQARGDAPVEHGLQTIRSAADLAQVMERLFLQLADGDSVAPRRATAILGVAGYLMRAIHAASLERELAATRERLAEWESHAAELENDRDQARDALCSLERQNSELHRCSEAYRRELKYVGIEPDSIRPVP